MLVIHDGCERGREVVVVKDVRDVPNDQLIAGESFGTLRMSCDAAPRGSSLVEDERCVMVIVVIDRT